MVYLISSTLCALPYIFQLLNVEVAAGAKWPLLQINRLFHKNRRMEPIFADASMMCVCKEA